MINHEQYYTYIALPLSDGGSLEIPLSKFEFFADFIAANADRTQKNSRPLCVEAASAIIYGDPELWPILSISNRNWDNLTFDHEEIKYPSKEFVFKILLPLLQSFSIDSILIQEQQTTLTPLPDYNSAI